MRSSGVLLLVGVSLTGALAGCGARQDFSPKDIVVQEPFTDTRPGLESPAAVRDLPSHEPRDKSVDHNDPPPPIADSVRTAAATAGCTVQGVGSEIAPVEHVAREAITTVSLVPVSGSHNGRWADWGVYDRPVPFKYQLHNLEHGGVYIHYGAAVPVAAVNAVRTLWAKSPAYLLVAPDTAVTPNRFPVDAVVAGAQQRILICAGFGPDKIGAVEAFADEYRGRGPEAAPAGNSTLPLQSDTPVPVLRDDVAVDQAF